MTATDLATVVQLPTRPPAPACATCGGPPRMALSVGRGIAGVDASGRPRALGYLHEAVYFDYRQVPSLTSARLFCKRDGLAALALLAEMYVCGDDEPALDPDAEPADPNDTMRRHLAKDPT